MDCMPCSPLHNACDLTLLLHAMMTQVERILARSDEWTFDAFSLDKATQGRPLSTLAFYLMSREGLLKHYNLEPLLVARRGMGPCCLLHMREPVVM